MSDKPIGVGLKVERDESTFYVIVNEFKYMTHHNFSSSDEPISRLESVICIEYSSLLTLQRVAIP